MCDTTGVAAGLCLKDNKHNDSAVTWVNATLMQLLYLKVQGGNLSGETKKCSTELE